MQGHIIVAYDIVDDKTRRLVVNVLLNYGSRVQKSVFECNITEKEYTKMYAALAKLEITEDDSIRFYSLCEACEKKTESMGGLLKIEKNSDFKII